MKRTKLVLLAVSCSVLLGACSKPPSCDDKVSADLVKKSIIDFYTIRIGAARTSSFVLDLRDVTQIGKSEESGNYRCSAMLHFENLANGYKSSNPIRFETRLSEEDGAPEIAPFVFKLE